MKIPPKGIAISTFALACVLASAACVAKPFQEANISRWGADYSRFQIATGGADACSSACADDAKCQSWSYIKPGIMGPAGECRLKSGIPEGNPDPCCVSGIAAGAFNKVAEAEPVKAPEKPAAEGMTAATRKTAKPVRDSKEDALQMPIEAETPEALHAISAPIDLTTGTVTPAH